MIKSKQNNVTINGDMEEILADFACIVWSLMDCTNEKTVKASFEAAIDVYMRKDGGKINDTLRN